MSETWLRIVENLGDRLGGPISFRFILQPIVAAIFAIVSGWHDAKNGSSPYLWAIFTQPTNRAALIKDGWKRVVKVVAVALVLDLVYQFLVTDVHPGEAIIVAVLIVILPYVVVRGVTTRLLTLFGIGK
ncbi:MAG: hypothetical protein ABSC22_06105 [Roseiarcus sp.]